MNIKKFVFGIPFIALLAQEANAHCPLCTVGAAVAAGGASYLGVDKIVVGLFIGGFAVSTGWWVSNMIKKKFIPFQRTMIIIASFLSIVLPILPIMNDISSFYMSWLGGYGSMLNRTYIINLFLLGSLAGGLIVSLTPWISRKITAARGRTIPFQGVLLTLLLLLITGVILQIV